MAVPGSSRYFGAGCGSNRRGGHGRWCGLHRNRRLHGDVLRVAADAHGIFGLGDLDFGVSYENHTSYPAPGQIILYPGGISETEILLAYGGVHFASKMGQLAGNHFITLTSGLENLTAFGQTVLWKGAQKIRFEEV